MARAFRATSTGYRTDLEAHERRLLSGLCADVIELLNGREQDVGSERGESRSSSAERPSKEPASAGNPDLEQSTSPTSEHRDSLLEDQFAHFRRELAGLGVSDLADYDADSLSHQGSGNFREPELAAPDDAALMRLLPDGSSDEREAAQLRHLTESSVRESKLSDLRAMRMFLEPSTTSLTEEQAPIFGRALNDIRLTLAARLDITTDEDAERIHENQLSGEAGENQQFMAEVYSFTTWLQQSLFTAMLEILPERD